jgi:hypothetical protein
MLTIAGAFAMVAAATRPATAQAKPVTTGNFGVGYTDIGPAIGLGNLGSASASFGGRFEHGFKSLPDLGNGTLGIEASFDYYHWSGFGISESVIPFGGTLNYHFKLDDPKIDPFIGAGLGYIHYSVSDCNVCSSSAMYFIGRLGARYFFAPKMAAYADVGAGAATLNVGLMFRMN